MNVKSIMDVKPYGCKTICGRLHRCPANPALAGSLQVEYRLRILIVSGPDWAFSPAIVPGFCVM